MQKSIFWKSTFLLYVLCCSCQQPKSSPILDIAKTGIVSEAEKLIGTCLDVNVRNSDLQTPLHIAAKLDNYPMVIWLLAHDAAPGLSDVNGKTPYDLAYEAYHADSAFVLSEYQNTLDMEEELYKLDKMNLLELTLSIYDYRKPGLIHFFSQVGDMKNLQMAINDAQNLNIQNVSGKTPLHFSVINKNINATVLLLESGANPNLGDMNNKTPLHYAVESGNIEQISVLIKYNADSNIDSTCGGESALDLAKRLGYDELFK